MVRVAVTGASGFVGGRVVDRLLDDGHEVRALTRRAVEDLSARGVEVVQVTLHDLDPEALAGVDAVVHAAAVAGPDLETARTVNREGTAALVDAALAADISRFVHLSTTSVYDREVAGDATLDEGAALVTEQAGAPTVSSSGSAYAITKAEAEAEIQRGVSGGLCAAILRPPAVIGAGATSTWGTRVPQRILDGEPVPGPRASTYGFVAIDDLVDATIAALHSTAIDTVNVVSGHVTVGDYLDAVVDVLPDPPPPRPAEGEPWRGRYDRDRLAAVFGVDAQRSFEAAFAEIAAAWQSTEPSGDRP